MAESLTPVELGEEVSLESEVAEEVGVWMTEVSFELLLSELTVELSESDRFLLPDTRVLMSKESF